MTMIKTPIEIDVEALERLPRCSVLCDDRDFEVVASVTGQPVRRVTDLARPGRQTETRPASRADDEEYG